MAVKASSQVSIVDISDAYSVTLTSDSYTFIGNTTGAPSGLNCSTQVVSYCGAELKKSNISKVTCPTGISVTLTNNNTTSPTITFKTTATVTTACQATIDVSVDDVTIQKTFSFSVAKTGSTGAKGDKGDTGTAGKGVKSTSVTYQAWKDGTTTPTGTWSSTPPKTTANAPYLWTRTIITYTDNTTSTSYSVGATPEGIQVGGRNLIIGSTSGDGSKWTETGWSGSFKTDSSEKHTYKLVCKSGWHDAYYTGLTDYIGKTVTLHLVAKNISEETTATTNYSLMFSNNTNIAYHTEPLTTNMPIQDEWIEITKIFTVNSSGHFGIGAQCQEEGKNYVTTWLIKNLKLELGNKATDWTPAPEDVDEDINNAQSSADKANNAANNAQNSADNAQNTANDASNKADSAQNSADEAAEAAQKAKEQADAAQKASEEANLLANNAWQGIDNLSQVVVADSTGVKVKEAKNSQNYAQIRSDGMHVFTNDTEVAKFGVNSHINNLAVSDYMMFGAHRAELLTQNGEQGTAFYWIGDVQ